MKVGTLKTYLSNLQKANLITFFNPIKKIDEKDGFTVLCGEIDISNSLDQENSTEFFLRDLSRGNYSIILFDGSLVQFRYTVENERITGHRYCYIPSPFKVASPIHWTNYESIIRSKLFEGDKVILSSRIRFDYRLGAEDRVHPESHLTFNSQYCRIPVSGGIGIRRFLRFIFLNFVDPSKVNRHPDLFKLDIDYDSELSEEFLKEIHVRWVAKS